jgi:uncharacterized membrane protein
MDITPGKSSTGLEGNVAAGLAVLLGWIGGLIFFLVEKDSQFVKFWAFQAILICVSGIVLCAIPFVNFIGIPVYLVIWIISMVKAFGGKVHKWPVIGNIAAKQAGLE